MMGIAVVRAEMISNAGAGYSLVGVGVFDGAGRSDLLFDNASGQFAIWSMSGDSFSGGAMLGSPCAGWVYKGIGNFNVRGDSDILFENAQHRL